MLNQTRAHPGILRVLWGRGAKPGRGSQGWARPHRSRIERSRGCLPIDRSAVAVHPHAIRRISRFEQPRCPLASSHRLEAM